MDNTKDGGYADRPPILDDTNYDYQKAMMDVFLKSIDKKNLEGCD